VFSIHTPSILGGALGGWGGVGGDSMYKNLGFFGLWPLVGAICVP